jgi:hypothetical protein
MHWDEHRNSETEAAALRSRLATAEQWVRELANENAFLKAQLGHGPGLLLEGESLPIVCA